MRAPALARSQHGCRVALNIGGALTRVRPRLSVPLGATPGPRDSRAVRPPPCQRATYGRRHLERNDPMDVEAVQGEAPQPENATSRERARVGTRGGETAPTNNGRANGGLGSFAQPGISRRSTPERRQQGCWSPLASDGAHHRARPSPQRPSDTGPGSRGSSLGSQDSRRGSSSFALRGLLGGSRPARSQQGCCANLTGSSVQNRVRSSPPLPAGAAPGSRDLNPMSQDARLAAGSFVRRGALSGFTPARSQHGGRTAFIGSGAHPRVELPPPLPPGATRDSRDSRGVCGRPRQRATNVQRDQPRSNPTEAEPAQGEVPLEENAPSSENDRVEARGGLRHPDSGTTLERGTNGAAAAALGSPTGAETATGERRLATTRVPVEGLISSRTRARTRIAARAGTRSSDGGEGGPIPTEPLHGASPQQPTMTRLTQPTTPVEPVPSLPATGPGPPLTTPLPFEGSSIAVIEGSPPSPPPAPQPLPTNSRPSTGTPRSTPGVILALESSTESAARSTQLALPRQSQPTSALTPGGRSPGPAPTSERPPSPPRPPPQPPVERGQLQDETSEDCCVCYEILMAPMVHLGSCPHRLHLPCSESGRGLTCVARRAGRP